MANIADDRYVGLAPETLLCRWSDIVKKDFISANPDIVRVTEDGSRTVACMNQQTDMLRTMMGKMDTMMRDREVDNRRAERHREEANGRMLALESTNSILYNQINSLEVANRGLVS